MSDIVERCLSRTKLDGLYSPMPWSKLSIAIASAILPHLQIILRGRLINQPFSLSFSLACDAEGRACSCFYIGGVGIIFQNASQGVELLAVSRTTQQRHSDTTTQHTVVRSTADILAVWLCRLVCCAIQVSSTFSCGWSYH